MDEDHLIATVRYVGLNPVRARLVAQAADWPWSSARAHLTGEPDGVADLAAFASRFASSEGLFDRREPEAFERLRRAESIGRPVGGEAFLQRIADEIGRTVSPLSAVARGQKKVHCHRNSNDLSPPQALGNFGLMLVNIEQIGSAHRRRNSTSR